MYIYNLCSVNMCLLCLWTVLLHTGVKQHIYIFRARSLTAKAAQDSRGSMQGWRSGLVARDGISGPGPGAPD